MNLTLNDILTSSGRYPERLQRASPDISKAAWRLVERVNGLLTELNIIAKVSSGFRTPDANAAAGGAKRSNHMTGHAVDLVDSENKIDDLLMQNFHLLEKYELFLENPHNTPGWSHLQDKSPASGHRVFIP